MKRLYTLLTIVTFVVLSTSSVSAKIFSIGISAGSYHPDFTVEGYDGSVSSDIGFQAGTSVSIKLPFLEVTPELWYKQSNTTLTAAADSGLLDGKVKSKAVVLPVVVGFSILGPLAIEAGPSFMLYDKAKLGSTDLGKVYSETGYVAGLKLTLSKITLGARFNGQFSSRENSYNDTNYNIKNYSYSFSIGYKL